MMWGAYQSPDLFKPRVQSDLFFSRGGWFNLVGASGAARPGKETPLSARAHADVAVSVGTRQTPYDLPGFLPVCSW